MERLTTDTPMSNSERIVNFAYAKDGEIYVRWFDGKRDVNINDIVRYLATNFDCTNILDDVDDNEIFEVLIDELGSHYYSTVMLALATQAAELRGMLKQYEDAEENGLLVRLPFQEDAVLYVIDEKIVKERRRKVVKEYITKGIIDRFYFVDGNISFDVVLDNNGGKYVSLTSEDIGEVVFLTHEEAMQVLEDQEDNDE